MGRLLALALAGCAIGAPKPPIATTPEAPIGRLAGAPAALRPGVVSYPDLPALDAPPPPVHHHQP